MDEQTSVPVCFTPLPPGLADMPPGPELAVVLASLDRMDYNGFQLTDVVAARYRQLTWEQAQLLADINVMAHCAEGRHDAPPRHVASADSRVVHELSFAMAWTNAHAEDHLAVAWGTIEHQPVLYEAMAAGRLDLPKARMILDETAFLTDTQARHVINRILPDVDRQTLPKLRVRIRRLVMTIDPDAVTKRRKRDVDRRNVGIHDYRNGTSSIVGSYLPTELAAAAMEYLSAMTTATMRAGDPTGTSSADCDRRTAGQIRADIFLALLSGVDPTLSSHEGGAGAMTPAGRKGAINVTVELETLLCLNDHPGELEGFGFVPADIARLLADSMVDLPTWRMRITNQGRLILEDRLHYRPTAAQKSFVQARDQRCRAPSCRRPAKQSEIDHIHPWDDGGVTHEDNLCVVCRRHHRLKDKGFQLYRTDFGLVWITPFGRVHPISFGRDLNAEQRRLLQALVDHGEAADIFGPRHPQPRRA